MKIYFVEKHKPFFIFFTCFFTFLCFGQQQSNINALYDWFDNSVNIKNCNLFEGVLYKEEFIKIKGNNQFYGNFNFIDGLIIYDFQPYYNVRLKYDVFKDELVLIPLEKQLNSVQLVKDKITTFYLNDSKFINLKENDRSRNNNSLNGFFEIKFESENIILYKKNKKNVESQFHNNKIYAHFYDKSMYYIKLNQNFYHIDSKRGLTKLFPNIKNIINEFYKSHKKLLKSDFDSFMTLLTREINLNYLSNK